jgi:hypothetical protein
MVVGFLLYIFALLLGRFVVGVRVFEKCSDFVRVFAPFFQKKWIFWLFL